MASAKEVRLGHMVRLSVVAALGGLLFGYDTAVVSGTIDLVARQFSLDTMTQGWYVGCALVGSIAGVSVAGLLSDRLGRRPAMLLSAVLFTLSAAGCAVAVSLDGLVAWRVVGGVGIGVVSVVAPVYISEIAAARWRGRLVSLYQLAVTVGFLAAYWVNYLLLGFSQTAQAAQTPDGMARLLFVDEVWRAMLGAETLPAAVYMLVVAAVPESPRWLLVHGRRARAERVLRGLYASAEAVACQVAETLGPDGGATRPGWRAEMRGLLRPGILRAVVIGVCIAVLGQFMGVNAVLYYGPTIFADAGFEEPLFAQVLVGAVNCLTTVVAMTFIDHVGRKRLVYFGVSGMIVCLLAIAAYFAAGGALPSAFMLAFFLLYVFACAISISAVVFVFLSEMYPNSVRGVAMSIAGLALWVGRYLVGQFTPWMLATLTPAGTFVFFAAMCAPYILIVWRLMPETAGMTLEEIERFWLREKQPKGQPDE